ncbi:MAG TPA: 5-formyltetrahydrofolate cyclo-ligase [Cytophagaceae bacterium]|nr:5-formyltetrahydrofolate cyclo-ligase [Cytophagaceae bacterium]
MTKEELRKIYLEKRKLLTPFSLEVDNKLILDNFFNYDSFHFSEVSYMHLFLPIKNKMEVNTFVILERIHVEFPNIKIALSKSNFSDCSMQFFEYTDNTKFEENEYGIPEPTGGVIIQPEQLDLVVVPLLVIDEYGNRIGYGKGFYDRFLATCRPDCKKVGISFEEPVARINPDKFDVPLNFCVTPKAVFDFRKL